jgi:outer membrane scaffolding protein for murein synthesis (MipA/OmpV family)
MANALRAGAGIVRQLILSVVLLLGCAIPVAWAQDGTHLSLGDTAVHTPIYENGSVSAGIATPSPSFLTTGKTAANGLQIGGFMAWAGDGYRVDAQLDPMLDGRVSVNMGTSTGAGPGETGTNYDLRMGYVSVGPRFSVNPDNRLALTQVDSPAPGVNLTFTVNHALTPSLSVIGTAEARRNLGALPDGSVSQNQFLVGAGVGLRF